MEPYNNISLSIIFGEADSFQSEHVLFNILDFKLTYIAINDIPTLYQYQRAAAARMLWR
jgi:hypothetical protein